MSFHPAAIALTCLLWATTLSGNVAAQSNSSGNITGDARTGDTVTIFNPDTGMKREISIHKDGRYRVRSLPTGNYQVTITHADGTMSQTRGATLRVGSTAFIPADDAPAAPATTPAAPAQDASSPQP